MSRIKSIPLTCTPSTHAAAKPQSSLLPASCSLPLFPPLAQFHTITVKVTDEVSIKHTDQPCLPKSEWETRPLYEYARRENDETELSLMDTRADVPPLLDVMSVFLKAFTNSKIRSVIRMSSVRYGVLMCSGRLVVSWAHTPSQRYTRTHTHTHTNHYHRITNIHNHPATTCSLSILVFQTAADFSHDIGNLE